MANDNYPRGLFPSNWPLIPLHFYRVQTGNDIFLGELVDLDSTGYVTNALTVASGGNTVMGLGVAVGFSGPLRKGLATDDPYLDASDLTTLAPGLDAGDRWVAVADDPDQEFIIQADTGGTLATLAAVGETALLIYRSGGSGNTTTGWANLELDASTNAASTSNVVQILRLHDVVNTDGTENTAGANYAKWVVKVLNHRKRGIASGAPV